MLETLFKTKAAAPSAIAKLSDPDHPVVVAKLPPEPPRIIAPRAALGALSGDGERLREYAEVAASVGITTPAVEIENFRRFLAANDLPIFSLAEVVAYMDDKAERESKHKSGWRWCPLREKDKLPNMHFGTIANRSNFNNSLTKGSDEYVGPFKRQFANGGHSQTWDEPGTPVYDLVVPLHALRKVALIERAYKGVVAFFVCDYAPAPQFAADPFLMAVIPNPLVNRGDGRFVIDFWDEPGFGLDAQLAK